MRRHRNRAFPALAAALLSGGCVTSALEDVPLEGPSQDTIVSDATLVSIAFSTDSRYLARLDRTGTVSVWDVLLDKGIEKVKLDEFPVESVAMGGGQRFAVGGPQGIRVLRSGSGLEAQFPSTTSAIEFMLFDGPADHLAVAEQSGMVTIFSIDQHQAVHQFGPPTGFGSWTVQPGPGFSVLFVNDAGRIRRVSCEMYRANDTLEVKVSPASRVALCEDASTLAVATTTGEIEIWSVANPRRLATIADRPQPLAFDLTPDGSVLALATAEHAVELWDIHAGVPLDTFDSTVWEHGGISFSPDGHLLAWIEHGQTSVRLWAPVRSVIQWTAEGPKLREAAREVCESYAETLRFRLATTPFATGFEQLRARSIEEALASLAEVTRIFPRYPGLDNALTEARARQRAERLQREVATAEADADYATALRKLEEYLERNARYDEYGFGERAATLREMQRHHELAKTHLAAGRQVDAVIEFEAAAAIVTELTDHHPEFRELRARLESSLGEQIDTAYTADDFELVIAACTDLGRLRALTPKALRQLGDSYAKLDRRQQAERAYRAIEADAEQYADARRALARIARDNGEYPRAREELELARKARPDNAALETEYAEVCRQCGDPDAAVEAWARVGALEPDDPKPYESIATIEQDRQEWLAAATALRTAVARSELPRPQLLLQVAALLDKAGRRDEVLEVHLQLIALAENQPQAVSYLGSSPKMVFENRIRQLGYVHRRGEWISRDQFLMEQGWVQHQTEWLRRDEAQLRDVVSRFGNVPTDELRDREADYYSSNVRGRRVSVGMNRREVIQAWGFFADQDVLTVPDVGAVYEQLRFEHSRRVYLKNGIVCFWTE